jgi:GR25 family glycosyltransferase involved in LPS biosynthesis
MLITIINIILILVIILLVYNTKHLIFPLYNYQPFKNIWDENKMNKMIKLLTNSKKCLDVLNIDMIASYGTLLGLIRHQDVIPWDDDLDVIIDKKYFKTILDNRKLFLKYDIDIYLVKGLLGEPNFIKLYDINEPKIYNRGKNWSWPFIDIFGSYIKDDKFYIESNSNPYNYVLNIEDIYPLKNIKYKNITINIPNNSNNVLTVLYGNDWNDICYSSPYNHQLEKPFFNQVKTKCSEILSNINEDIFNNVFIINLHYRKDRLYNSLKILKNIGITRPFIYNAIDAKNDYIKNEYNKILNHKRTITEYSCYLSHKYLWEYIYSLEIPYAIILEDDICFDENLNKNDILTIINESKGFNILFLGHCYSTQGNFKSENTRVGTGLCLNAYVIKRNTIQKLLEINDDFNKAIDHITYEFCQDNICYLSKTTDRKENEYGEGIIRQDNNLGSNNFKNYLINLH